MGRSLGGIGRPCDEDADQLLTGGIEQTVDQDVDIGDPDVDLSQIVVSKVDVGDPDQTVEATTTLGVSLEPIKAVGPTMQAATGLDTPPRLTRTMGATAAAIVAGQQTIDGFEDADLAEYSGSTGDFTTQTSTVASGTAALKMETNGGNASIGSTSGLANYPDVGDTHKFRIRFGAAANTQTKFGTANPESSSGDDGYVVGIDLANSAFLVGRRDSGSLTILDKVDNPGLSQDIWYEVEVSHASDGTLSATIRKPDGTEVASVSATDTTHLTDGSYDATGIGFMELAEATPVYWDHWRIV